MQPTIVFTAPVPGMIYLNGRFIGEASAERPLFAPVSPCGAAYLEYRPLYGEGSLARRCVFSGGAPIAESLAGAGGLCGIAWPGGVLELEFTPSAREIHSFALEGLPCAIARGEDTVLTLNGLDIPLPEGALPPRLIRAGSSAALLGDILGGGQYLVSLSQDLTARTGLACAERIEPAGGDTFSAVVPLDDSVGHGRLEQWILDAGGLSRASAESVWSRGAPRWPATAEGAMIAAVEAALAGLRAESDGYLSPALAAQRPLAHVDEICDLCVPMKYGIPDGHACVGLLKSQNDRLATVRPLYYRAGEAGGTQGPWRIESLWTD